FETGSELREHFGLAAEMIGLRIDEEGVWRPLRVKLVSFAAAENRAHAAPGVRRKTRARNRITQCKCAKDGTDGTIMTDPLLDKYRDGLVLEDIEARLGGVECKSLNTDTSVTTEEIFYVAAAAPGVIAANISVVCAEHRTAFTGALYDVNQRRIRSELGIGECIGAPEIHIPFMISVPIRTWRWRDLLHLFS